jgi:UPF0755 protein
LALPSLLRKLLLSALLAVVALAGAAWYEVKRPLVVPGEYVEVRVVPGSSARSIAGTLRAAGVPLRTWEFVIATTVTRSTRSLRSGRYRVAQQTSILGLVEKLRRGEVEREQLTIVEGTRFADLRKAIAESKDLRHDSAAWSEEQILHAVGAQETRSEGLFAPDTYFFDPDSSDLEVYRQAYAAQRERLYRAWAARDPDLPYADPYQALIMASIIEKETGVAGERSRVAAVFVNRQRLGMPLQTDPTVIYGLGPRFDGRLHKRDLQADTPYNTYTRAGLPPTPISLPGREAIEAALHPDPSKILYFVSRGDGSSEFSVNLAEHNRAVDRYQRAAARRAAPQ